MLSGVAIVRATRPDVRLRIAGRITDPALAPLVAKAVEEGWCEHHPWLPPLELRDYSMGAGVGLVPYLPMPDHLSALPTKLFEYMAMGIPVLASDFPLWRHLVEASGAGRVVEPVPGPLASTLLAMLADPEALKACARAGRRAYQEGLCWDVEKNNLLWHYQRAGLLADPAKGKALPPPTPGGLGRS